MPRLAGLAIESVRVVNALEAFAGGSVAIADGVPVDVTVALARLTGNVVQRITVETVGAHLAVMTGVA